MVKTPEEKLAELSVLVNDLKQKFPEMEHSMSELSNTLTREQMNIGMLTKQYDKLYEVVENFKEIQFNIQKLNEDSKKFSEQIDLLRIKFEEILTKEKNCEMYYQIHKKEDTKNGWNLEKIITTAPNILAVLSFIGYICYLIFLDKIKTGSL